MSSVLVIAAHPDDEILGCGATMAWHVRRGDAVRVLIAAEGATARRPPGEASSDEVDALQAMALRANAILGVRDVRFLGLPDNRMDTLALLDVVKLIEKAIEDLKPEIVYTHHAGDLNVDHRILNTAVVTACRPLPAACVRRVFSFEVPSSTDFAISSAATGFLPNWFVDAETTIDLKLRALEEYVSEMRPFPHARSLRSIEALARARGASVGLHAAEAFQLLRAVLA